MWEAIVNGSWVAVAGMVRGMARGDCFNEFTFGVWFDGHVAQLQ